MKKIILFIIVLLITYISGNSQVPIIIRDKNNSYNQKILLDENSSNNNYSENISSDFGARHKSSAEYYDFHGGIDLTTANILGSTLLSPIAGKFTFFQKTGLCYIIIDDMAFLHIFEDNQSSIGEFNKIKVQK